MKIGIVFNSKSGRGHAAQIVRTLHDALQGDGHALTIEDVAESTCAAGIAARDADILLVAGGDGSIHHALDAAKESGAALYHVPMGTENLFARQFGMSRDVVLIRRAITAQRIKQIDLGSIERQGNVTPFCLMMSIGMDASIMHRMAASRRGAISHFSYTRPIIAEVLRPTFRPISVHVDGKQLVEKQSGLLIVANSSQYALRLDPAARATMDDGKLDVVFLPAETIFGAMHWYAASMLRDHLENRAAQYMQGERISVQARTLPSQVDGEAWHPATQDVTLSAVAKGLRVLLPAD
jgi:diacylglycerol kinase (ATP)